MLLSPIRSVDRDCDISLWRCFAIDSARAPPSSHFVINSDPVRIHVPTF